MFVPNPSATSSLQLSMLSFVGKLMGAAIRGRHMLNLDLPPLLWKLLVGAPVSRCDLEQIDGLFYKTLDQVRHCDQTKPYLQLIITQP
jgi:hypothetical protein